MLYPFISLMGDESEAEPAVEVTDPAVPAAQQDLWMASLIKANKFMDTYFDPRLVKLLVYVHIWSTK